MRAPVALIAVFALMGCGQARSAQGPLAIDQVHARTAAKVTVATSAIGEGGQIAPAFSAYGADRSMPLTWSRVAGAGAWAVIVQDPDATSPTPFLHWLIWNIPAPARGLTEDLPRYPRLSAPPGAYQGPTGARIVGYFGPRPPAGPAHHYHIQVFALDGPLAVKPGGDLTAVIGAMQGHVIADGQIVGTFAAPHP